MNKDTKEQIKKEMKNSLIASNLFQTKTIDWAPELIDFLSKSGRIVKGTRMRTKAPSNWYIGDPLDEVVTETEREFSLLVYNTDELDGVVELLADCYLLLSELKSTGTFYENAVGGINGEELKDSIKELLRRFK
jgi:hypothetical protein